MADTTTNKRICDICNKEVKRWDMTSVKKIQYIPGKRYEKCSSDITSRTTILANLCPICLGKLEKMLYSL